jgi:hypothetical protein
MQEKQKREAAQEEERTNESPTLRSASAERLNRPHEAFYLYGTNTPLFKDPTPAPPSYRRSLTEQPVLSGSAKWHDDYPHAVQYWDLSIPSNGAFRPFGANAIVGTVRSSHFMILHVYYLGRHGIPIIRPRGMFRNTSVLHFNFIR